MIIKESLQIPLYGGKLTICIVDDKSIDLNDHFKDLPEKISIDYAHTFLCNIIVNRKLKRSFTLLFNIKNEYAKITNGTISHEALHATDLILYYAGLQLNEHSSEAYSYLIAWIVDNIYRVFNKNNLPIYLKQ